MTIDIQQEIGDDAGMSTGQIASLVIRRWRVVVSASLIFGAVAAIIGFAMTPVYRSTTLLIPNDSSDKSGALGSAIGQLGGIAALAGLGGLAGGNQTATNEALAVLQSRQFVLEFIDLNKLMPVLYRRKWDSQTNDWKHSVTVPTPGRAYKLFSREILDVYQDKKTSLVTVSISWTDRVAAADWANQLVEKVNERMREVVIREADQTIKFLQQELPSADTVETRRAISSMMESQLKLKALAAVRKQYAFRVIDPAVPSDSDVRLRPHKAIYTLIGLAMGFLTGVAIVFLTGERREIADPRLS